MDRKESDRVMKSHRWVRSDKEGRTENPEPDDSFKKKGVLWVKCLGCEALIVTNEDLFPSDCHEGWLPEDCDLTIVRDVMES
jgi:hypothetical protein